MTNSAKCNYNILMAHYDIEIDNQVNKYLEKIPLYVPELCKSV